MSTSTMIQNETEATPSLRIPKEYLLCFLSSLIWGLLAHGMTLFNKYSLYEDISQLYGVGATYTSGRWMLDILYNLEVFFLGGPYSLPLINGLTSILYISLCACIVVKLLEVRRKVLIISICGVMITSPTMAGLFGYMFTAPHYCLGYLLACTGVLLICDHRKWYSFLVGCLLIASSVGIYQATIPLALCLMLLWFIHRVYTSKVLSWLHYFLWILYLVGACLLFVVLYLVINNLYLDMVGANLSNYQGIDSMGSLPLTTYLKRVIYACKVFLLPNNAGSGCMYPNGLIYLYWIIFGLCVVVGLALLFFAAKERISKLFQTGMPLIAIPLAINFIYIMCDPQGVHSLMVYSHIMLPIFLIWEIDKLCEHMKHVPKIRFTSLACVVLLLCAMYVRFDNICYLKAELVQAQTISYFTTMVTKIKSVEGYQDGMPVAYVNYMSKHDSSLRKNKGLSDVNIIPYFDTEGMINSFAFVSFVQNWCGYSPQFFTRGYNDHPEVQEMPCYPNDGSIKIIDNVVVIKFG